MTSYVVSQDSFILSAEEAESAISQFQELLRFPTISGSGPTGSYDACAEWLLENLSSIGGLSNVHVVKESIPHKPCVVATWLGSDRSLPCILLNSHYDVVPTNDAFWHVPPFEAQRRDGKIFARGAQDMKCVCVQYLVALHKLCASGFQPLRTLHISYVPDEEIGW
jgi:aminoacylase